MLVGGTYDSGIVQHAIVQEIENTIGQQPSWTEISKFRVVWLYRANRMHSSRCDLPVRLVGGHAEITHNVGND